MRCPTCKGTGQVPDEITLECVGCQTKRVKVRYDSTAELLALCDTVLCADCNPREKP